MDFSRGLMIPEEKQKQQNQNRAWIPITPSKPIPTREQSISVYTEGNQPGITTDCLRQAMFQEGFFSEIPTSTRIVENFNFNSGGSVDQRDLSYYWEAATALGSNNRGDLVGSNNRGDLGSDKAAWNNLACSDLLALAEAASGASKASASGSDRGDNNAASTASVPASCSQIPTNLQQPDLASMLFQNQNLSVSSSMPNNNSPLQIPHYGYPGSYHPSYDLNFLPNLNDTVYDGPPMPFQFEPFTPDHSKRLKKSIQVSETVNACLDEQLIQEHNKQQEAVGHTGNVVPEPSSNQPASAPVDSSNAAVSNQMNENFEADKGGDNGIDLNTPPQRQKPKRKKYTPKVVREGKPKNTPKPKTPKQASTTENLTGRRKRKYVRKTGPKASETPSVECVKDTVHSTSESAARSCKRSFNFDLESQARDESHRTILDLQKDLPSWNVNRSSYLWDFSSNLGIQAQDVHTDHSGSPTKSLLQGTQGWEVIVENSRARTAFDLNHYSTKKQCISLPEQTSSGIPPPTERELRREYLKVHSRDINVTRTADECVSRAENGCPPIPQQIHTEGAGCIALPTKTAPNGLQSMSTSHTNFSNGNGTEQARGSKREYCNINKSQLCSLNLLGAQFNSLQAYHEIFQKIHKKKRTEKVQNTIPSSLLSPNKAVEDGSNARQTMSRRLSNPNSIYFASQVNYPQSAPRSDNTISTTDIRNHISNSGSNLHPHSVPVGHNAQVQNSSPVLSHVEALRGTPLDKLPEFMLSYGETGWKTKMRSKGSTRARNSASLTAIFQCNKMTSTPPKTEQKQANRQQVQISDGPMACIQALAAGTHAKLTKKKRSRKGPPMARSASYSRAKELYLNEHGAASYEYRQSFAKYRGISLEQKNTGSIALSRSSHSLSINATLEHQSNSRNIGGKFHAGSSKVTNNYLVTIHNYLIAVDEIVNKFRCLSINSGSDMITVREQNAMVLFGKVDTMVPYAGPFDPIKRRRPRAKVDLDPETDRVWRLLMGKECRLSIEGTEADTEKWWEEERRIFRGRADSFIARMHLVQGDRRFTQWKGSVVDSVIGVFLTQNVSDHLSSSAFMSLAARFPLQSTSNHRGYYEQRTEVFVEEPEGGIADTDDAGQWHKKISTGAVCDQGYIPLYEGEHIAEREVAECIDSFGSNKGGCRSPDNSKGKQSAFCKSGLDNLTTETEKSCSEDSEDRRAVQDVVSSQNSIGSSENSACSSILQTSDRSLSLMRISTCLVEAKISRALEDVVSSENLVFSSQNCDSSILQTAERVGSCSDSNSEAEDVMTGCKSNSFDCSTSFTKLLHMAGTSKLQEYYSHGQGSFSPDKKLDCGSTQSESTGSERSSLEGLDCLKDSFHSIYPSNSKLPLQEDLVIPSSNYHLQKTPDLGTLEVQCLEASAEQRKLLSISTASEITDRKGMDSVSKQNCLMEETASETTVILSGQAAGLVTSLSKHSTQLFCSSGQEAELKKHSHSCNNFEVEQPGTMQPSIEPENLVEELAPRRSNELQQGSSSLPDCPIENLHVKETMCLMTQEKHTDNKDMASNLEEQVLSSEKPCSETAVNTLKVNGKPGKEKKAEFDWDSLRKDAYLKSTKRERTRSTMDTLDYEALRCAKVGEIADSIKERGMNNMLAERIKDFLNRLVRDHGSIDLEWLKDVPPDKAKEYLLSFRGLGLKSVECVRLLTLHQLAFPVDVNVGRIAVRLGWVPLQPLPESLQLHLLELYPMQETIQKYLWPRLCTLDQRTLYELHYQMITFGKVFCTKTKPNCNACPLRAECKHFASAFASARLALPAPEEKGMVPASIVADKCPSVKIKPMQITLPETKIVSESRSTECEPIIEEPETTLVSETISGTNECKPIIEEPASPETKRIEISESDMEDAFYEDPDEIPTINLNIEEFATNITNFMQKNNMELQVDDMSKALVALTPEAASIPVPKLKNVSRLRTEHEVYVLPDSHPLLEGLDRREPDDPSSYLLAIWTPGETPESTEPPKISCGSHDLGNLCTEKTCFSCNSVREAKSQIVRGTILIPCKTAMRGSFPLNGTYFQVNEVFADHDSSQCPINVPRNWLWNLPRRTVFFGTSVISIFKGLSTEVIQSCFWRGFVCVRGFDRTTRSPRPLKARLHYTATRLKQEEARNKQ